MVEIPLWMVLLLFVGFVITAIGFEYYGEEKSMAGMLVSFLGIICVFLAFVFMGQTETKGVPANKNELKEDVMLQSGGMLVKNLTLVWLVGTDDWRVVSGLPEMPEGTYFQIQDNRIVVKGGKI